MSKNLGDGFVRVRPDTSGFAAEAESGMSSGLKRLGALIAGVFASGAAIKGANALVGRASDLNETVNKSNIIFGRQAGMIRRWAKDSATSLGLPREAALASAASFGDMFTQIGFAEKASARMSKSTIKMAADLGSFNNLETDDVLNRISAALRGEYDSLQAVIPNINAARVQQVALAQTGKESASALTAQEKAAATLAIIHKDGARAAGDFARTQDGLANSNKINAALIEDLKTKIGSGLLPVWQAGSRLLRTEVLPPLIELADTYLPKVAKAVADAVSGKNPGEVFKAIGDSVRGVDWGGIAASLGRLGDAGKELGPAFKEASAELPSVNDLLNVSAVVLKFAAENVDLLAKALPFLVAGFAAYKLVQAGANAAATLSVPLRVAEVVATRAQTKAIQQLAAAQGVGTVAQTVNNAATAAGTRLTVRQRIATIATTVASKAAMVATKAWAVAQRVLNAVMRANPLGLIITAIALVVAGLVLAYKKSETFRGIVNKLWGVVKGAGRTLADFGGRILGLVADGFDFIVDAVRELPGKIRALGGALFDAGRAIINRLVDGLKNAGGVVSGIAGNVWSAVQGMLNGAIDKINASLEFTIKLPGPDLTVNPPNIPHLWTGARVTRPQLAMIGDGREPETVMNDTMLTKALAMAAAMGANGLGDRGGRGVEVHNHFPTSSHTATAEAAARTTAALEAWGV